MTDNIAEQAESQSEATVNGETPDAQSPDGEKKQKHCGFSRMLNKYFHHIDRGGSLRSEVTAGILMCILAICGMFVNMQTVARIACTGSYAEVSSMPEVLAANGETIASIWFMSMLIAFIGSMVIGLVARLPFVQVTGLGLSSVLISLVGTNSGLTYYNLLAVSLFGSVVYTVAVSVPAVKRFFAKLLPTAVKKAIPIAFGVLLTFIAMQLSGVITVNGSAIPAYGTGSEFASTSDKVGISSILGFGLFDYASDRFHPALLISCLCVLLAFVLVLVFKSRKAKHPYLWSLLISQGLLVVLQVLTVAINWDMMVISVDSLFGRAWMLGSEDAMQLHLGAVFEDLSIGKVFTQGFDFSAYTGNVFLLFLTGIATMACAFGFTNHAVITTADDISGGVCDKKSGGIALICNAGANVAASLLGAPPVMTGAEAVAGADDSAKSGIASVVAAIGFFASMFVWVIPAVFLSSSSSAIQMNLYGHYGKVMQLLLECSFGVADGIMAIVGLSMIKNGIKQFDCGDAKSIFVAIAVIAGSFFFGNVVYGVALGVVLHTVTNMLVKPEEGKGKLAALKEIGYMRYIVCSASALLILFAYML